MESRFPEDKGTRRKRGRSSAGLGKQGRQEGPAGEQTGSRKLRNTPSIPMAMANRRDADPGPGDLVEKGSMWPG